MEAHTNDSTPEGPLSPLHNLPSPSPGMQLRRELSAQRRMSDFEDHDGQDHPHSKPITPADVFDNDSVDGSANGSAERSASPAARPSSRDLMPPPPKPLSRQGSQSPQMPELVHPAFRGQDTLPSRRASSEPAFEPSGSSRSSPITIGSPELGDNIRLAHTTSPVLGQHSLSDDDHGMTQSESQDGADEPLEPFNWKALEQRYHDMIDDKEKEFDAVWEEYCQLQDFFNIWCGMMGKRETDRTYKRHKTQQFYVQQEEKSLDNLRQHYDKVMTAFNNAMAMLGPPRES